MTTSRNSSVLSVEESGALSFTLPSGPIWSTRGPLFILHYYDRQHPRAQMVPVPFGETQSFGTAGTPSLSAKADITVRPGEGGEFAVVAEFTSIQVSMVFRIRPTSDGSGFSIHIADEDISENLPRLYRILSVEVLPEFGAARSGEEGYLTLPNWSGCQTFYNKTYPREVRQTIYSSNDQWEHVCCMPVFGITRAQGTLCGLVAQGDYDARLISRVHWEQAQSNSSHPDLVYRWEQQDERITGPREVRYSFTTPDDASGEGYVFCAKVYRQFLREERGLQTWAEKAATRPVVLSYRDRFFLKIFMAYKDPQADGKGTYHITCSFAEVREILEDCLRRGITRLTTILVGWGQDGHDGMPPTRFPVDERLGGEVQLRDLAAWCEEKDILLGVHDSYGGYYSCSPEFNTDDLIRHRSGEYWETVIWSGGQCHNACPKVYVDKHVHRDVPAVKALGIHGHHHVDAVGSFMTCFSEEHPLERRADFIREVRRMFTYIVEQMGSVSTEMPFGPYFDVVDGFFHSYTSPSAWHRASTVGRYFLDRSIPLLTIALHGSVLCQEGMNKFRNQPWYWLLWGLAPEWEVAGRSSPSFGIPQYKDAVEDLQKIYEMYYGGEGLQQRLNGLEITARHELPGGVVQTEYSDGTRIVVNPTETEQMGLGPQSFHVDRR